MAEADPKLVEANRIAYMNYVPEDIRQKADKIATTFAERGYGLPGTPPEWEKAGQTTAKLKATVGLRDEGLGDQEYLEAKTKKYFDIIRRFNIESGTFDEVEDH
jgi:hypothetical protein